ncbi:MAG TPA: SPOR domain-containing protein [Terriglobia bacterium]|nr:SPOR domain-containing protein [Terriglobia bacterium]
MSNDARGGLSAIQLALVSLTGIAVCAVFFALGFLVARNQQPPTVLANANTEPVPPPGPAPTPVKSPVGATTSENTSPAPAPTPVKSPVGATTSENTSSAPAPAPVKSAVGATTSEHTSPASAPAEGGIISRSNPAPNPGSSAPSASTSSTLPIRAREVPLKNDSKRLPAAPVSSPTQSAASNLAGASNAVAAPPSRPAGPAPGGKIVVQVSAVGVRQDAETLVTLLKSRGYPAFLVTPEAARARDKLFRVQVGPYKSDPEAIGVRNKLVADGFKPFVRH